MTSSAIVTQMSKEFDFESLLSQEKSDLDGMHPYLSLHIGSVIFKLYSISNIKCGFYEQLQIAMFTLFSLVRRHSTFTPFKKKF